MKKYPGLKIGFTTANFMKFLPPTLENVKQLIDFASKNEFSFIEIRDPNARLSLRECRELAAYATRKKVEIVYAMGVGLLDDNYWEIFSRGVANANVLPGPKVVRTALGGQEFSNDPDKATWTGDEFAKLVKRADKAGNMATMFGLRFLVENGREALKGDGRDAFGLEEFFGPHGVNANVGLQMDVANFFCVSRAPARPEDVKAFVERNVSKVVYVHLKSSKDHKPQQVLDGNELPFEVFFSELQKAGKSYVAIELDGPATAADAFSNHIKSIGYLKSYY
jgi:sugar phosphate isomerase/epimerase